MDSVIKIVFACFLFFSSAFAEEKSKVIIPEVCANMPLNGAGIRNRFFFDLYIAALYLPSQMNDAKEIVNKDEKMGIKLIILSSIISNAKMRSATKEGFEKALDGNTETLKEEIDTFMGVFKEQIQKNDVFDFVYTPEIGVDIYKNGTYQKTIKGLLFKQALFKIWLGDNPVQKSLKAAMLGI